MAEKRVNYSSGAPLEEKVGYSRMVKVGDHIYVGGTTSVQPDGTVYGENAYEQTRYVLEKQVKLIGQAGAGVGDVISNIISSVIPSGNIVIGVIVYVLGMVIFTMIMGNAFAAFTVITIGIGIPFVINQGGDPSIVAALGMTAGYCGTLLTPMAANFNIVPCAVLETKDQKWTVIKSQLPMAMIMIVIHIVLMLVLAF